MYFEWIIKESNTDISENFMLSYRVFDFHDRNILIII